MTHRVEFWSSTEAAAFQKALVRELQAAGCPAEEKFGVPQADYWAARSRGQRLGLRARAYGLYPWRLWRHFARSAPGLVGIVCSNTFYAPWLAMKAAGPSRKVIHWVFDLFPDVLNASGWPGAGGARERWMRGIMRATFDTAAANVFLGENLRQFAESKFGTIPRAHVIEIGADGTPFRDAEPTELIDTRVGETLTVLYCGNLGRMHEVDTLIAALPGLGQQPWRLQVAGNGSGYEQLRRRAGSLPRIEFGPNLESAAWANTMKNAGVALVTLKEQAGGLVMPSKTYSALVAGQAVLAICPLSSDLARLVRRHEAGWVISPGDAPGLIALMKQILRDPEDVLRKRRNAWRAGHKHYEQRVIAQRWLELIEAIASPEVDRAAELPSAQKEMAR
jgi:glycosyltransferase involved in cell wall biosynthesis